MWWYVGDLLVLLILSVAGYAMAAPWWLVVFVCLLAGLILGDRPQTPESGDPPLE